LAAEKHQILPTHRQSEARNFVTAQISTNKKTHISSMINVLKHGTKLAMAALRSRCGHNIFALWFLSSSFFFLFLFLA